jgi:ABC-type sugar transport system ATPase subunit
MPGDPPVIELRDVTKTYPGVMALRGLDLAIAPGRVHAVVGLNGAGKSTLIRVMAGSISADRGSIVGGGEGGRSRLVNMVPQDILVVPDLSIGRNILLGRERRFPIRRVLGSREREHVETALAMVGLDLDPEIFPSSCTIQELRLIQIARALADPAEVLLLDEPTAVLPEGDASRLLETLRSLRDAGEAIVYVSHRLDEVLEIADEITVLRDGVKVETLERTETDRPRLLEMLTKGAETEAVVADTSAPGAGVLELEAVAARGVRPVDLVVGGGEVVVLVGVQGAGQSELVQAIAGLSPMSGAVRIDGREVEVAGPERATGAGILLVPADRRARGVVSEMDLVDNIALSPRSAAQRFGVRRRTREREVAAGYVERFEVKTPGLGAEAGTLSGGNQQKVVLGRAMEADPRVLLLDEPTQGIDVATKWDILARIKSEARGAGFPVLAATSELEEVPGWADRALVFRLGRVVAELEGSEITEERLIEHAVS